MLRRAVLPLALIALVATPAAASARTPSAKLLECDADARTAVFEGRMRAVPGTERMQMRFTVSVRGGEQEVQSVAAPTLNTWTSSQPRRRGYVYDKRLENLRPGTATRVTVRFRWRDAAGEVLRTATRRSRSCRVPDLRPDLEPVSIAVAPGGAPDRRAYLVTIANTGRSAAAPSSVAFSVDGVALEDQQAPAIEPGEEVTVAFEGPACAPGGTLVSIADASSLIDEAEEADDTLGVACSTR